VNSFYSLGTHIILLITIGLIYQLAGTELSSRRLQSFWNYANVASQVYALAFIVAVWIFFRKTSESSAMAEVGGCDEALFSTGSFSSEARKPF